MSNLAITLIIAFVFLVIISNIILVKKSAKFGLKNKDGSPASSQDKTSTKKDTDAEHDTYTRIDNNKNWDDSDY